MSAHHPSSSSRPGRGDPRPGPLSSRGRSLLDRRAFLERAGAGLGQIALLSLLSAEGRAARSRGIAPFAARDLPPLYTPPIDPAAPYAARSAPGPAPARRVLQIFCSGALSHVDTFDHKPALERHHGQPMPGAEDLVTFQGKNGNLTRSPWTFRPRGECGKFTSDLLPRLGAQVDRMCFLHSLTAKSNTHGPGENQMSTGFTIEGFPSLGSWVSYALGCEADDLPAFVSIPDPRGVPQSSVNNWASGFLPAVFQGCPLNADMPIRHLQTPAAWRGDPERASRELLRRLNDRHLQRHPGDSQLMARIASYELAARMQLRAAEVTALDHESPATRRHYGAESQNPLEAAFARNCILARRLLERGVRFVQLFNGAYAMGEGVGNWDGHKALKDQYSIHGPILDRPAAALLDDLAQRGLLDDTLVVFVTEFGRMPTFQAGASGRDHNPSGFTAWMAGAGVKAPYSHGATDDFGHRAVDQVLSLYDLHATILHLLGLDHEALRVYHEGQERRLTDVHGHVIEEVLAG